MRLDVDVRECCAYEGDLREKPPSMDWYGSLKVLEKAGSGVKFRRCVCSCRYWKVWREGDATQLFDRTRSLATNRIIMKVLDTETLITHDGLDRLQGSSYAASDESLSRRVEQ
jgi:hypothetical protein